MRAIVLAVVAIQVGLAYPACAQTPADADRSISEALPLFGKNRCEQFKDPAEQLFCGDPELGAAAARLSRAIQDRLDRLPHRHLAIKKNALLIKNRSSSFSICVKQSVPHTDRESVKSCLLK